MTVSFHILSNLSFADITYLDSFINYNKLINTDPFKPYGYFV